jgi:CO/xanthine dehydrogenase FAD-binding subunit
VTLTGPSRRPERVGIACGSVAPTVIRASRAEAILLEGGLARLEEAKQAVREEVQPIDDIRSTKAYRREMAALLLERVLRQCAESP